MDLTRMQKRELMWLASVAEEDGTIRYQDLFERKGSLGGSSLEDFGYRYDALEAAGFVDSRCRSWEDPVAAVRLTEEGREMAELCLQEELNDPLLPDETRKGVKGAFISQGVAVAIKALLSSVDFA